MAEHGEKALSLVRRQPVPEPYAVLLYTLNSPDSRRKIGAKQPAVCGLVSKATNRRQPEIDRRRRIMGLVRG
jgi:hypothetical protein